MLVGAQTPEELRYYHTDAIGSVRVVTDEAAAVVARYDYEPFGQEVPPVTADNVRPFAGKERDVESGLDYVGARYYASLTGRFTAVDPTLDLQKAFGESQLRNRYAYVSNNPPRFQDPELCLVRLVQDCPSPYSRRT